MPHPVVRVGGDSTSATVTGIRPGDTARFTIIAANAAGDGVASGWTNSLRVHLEREADDYTRDKTDHKDAVLIGRLVVRLECYLPERAGADWARLRHLGSRRARLITESTSCQQQIADLLGCCWPSAAAKPLESKTWLACLAVVVDADGDLATLAAGGLAAFTTAARAYAPRFGAHRVYHRIVRGFFAALDDPGGVADQQHNPPAVHATTLFPQHFSTHHGQAGRSLTDQDVAGAGPGKDP